jgi:hypothetical protein
MGRGKTGDVVVFALCWKNILNQLGKLKMKMKKISVLGAVSGLVFATNLHATLVDGAVTLTQAPYVGPNGGGEYQAVTSGLGTFQTFCTELNVNFTPGIQYNYIINTGAVPGDTGADAYNQKPLTGSAATSGPYNLDNISIGTAWLYSQFRAGTLKDSSGGAYSTAADEGTLQLAIWYLEGEQNSTSPDNGAAIIGDQSNNTFIKKAESSLNLTLAQLEADSKGAYNVVVLNLYDGSGNFAQDQLAMVPEPATIVAGALLLLPLGLSTLRILRRTRKA